MIQYDELLAKSMEQFKSDWDRLQKALKENDRLAEAIMKLRKLGSDARFTLMDMLSGDIRSFLEDFQSILDEDEFMNLPATLERLIHMLSYNIVDDGFLRVLRIEFERHYGDDITDKEVKYILYADESTDPVKRANLALEFELQFLTPTLVSAKTASFNESVDTFIKFLNILTKKKNWKKFDFIGSAEIDNLLEFK